MVLLIFAFSINSFSTLDEATFGALAEWLSRMTRNHIPSGAQVRVLQASVVFILLYLCPGGVVLCWCDFGAGCGLGGGGNLPKPRLFHANDSSPTLPEPPECRNAEGRARRARKEMLFFNRTWFTARHEIEERGRNPFPHAWTSKVGPPKPPQELHDIAFTWTLLHIVNCVYGFQFRYGHDNGFNWRLKYNDHSPARFLGRRPVLLRDVLVRGLLRAIFGAELIRACGCVVIQSPMRRFLFGHSESEHLCRRRVAPAQMNHDAVHSNKKDIAAVVHMEL
jgi:hypothetical protein